MKHNLLELVQLREVLLKVTRYNYKSDLEAAFSFPTTTEIPKNLSVNMTLIVGVIRSDRVHVFERILWRLTRGMIVCFTDDISIPLTDSTTGETVSKSFFSVFVQGKELVERVQKLCHAYNAKIYDVPESEARREELLGKTIDEIIDIRVVIRKTSELQLHTLDLVAKSLQKWKVQMLKAKAIYSIMNLLNADIAGTCLTGEIWIPNYEVERVRNALSDVSTSVQSVFAPILNPIKTDEDQPTHFKKNKFLQGFQALVEAYGIPNYREVNPSVCTIITFPFLFALMFGDIGHGLIMFMFGLWMILKETALLNTKSKNEIWNILFSGRYIITFCGFFSIYAGFIYNDIFSKSINFFGSSWRIRYNFSTVHENAWLTLDPNTPMFVGRSYPFGLDPVWQLSNNKIIYQNAFKMKISIIFGVIHMLFGIILSCVNHLHFTNYLAILTEFIPQIIFMSAIFLYLVILMFYKWVVYTPAHAACAPSLLITFINMLMFKKSEPLENCDLFLYPNQELAQMTLVFIALICVPWMLFIKPVYINFTRKPKYKAEEPISEIFIHQIIHTIEFVLGSVSHTASYLRLWALSLAHGQLAEVLWRMIMTMGIKAKGYTSGVKLWMIFSIWATATLAILVVMEGLSAFLHTLRLHWVESQVRKSLSKSTFNSKSFTFDFRANFIWDKESNSSHSLSKISSMKICNSGNLSNKG